VGKTNKLLIIHDADNVALALEDISAGEEFSALSLTAADAVPAGHKIAITDIGEGEAVFKYGSPIGHASRDICKGRHVHVHNLKTNLCDIINYSYQPEHLPETAARDEYFPLMQAKDRRQAENALRSAAIRASATRKHSEALALRAQTVAGSASHSQPVASENRSLVQCEYFTGYLRESGDAGIRNEIWVINTVGCINKVSERVAALANERFSGETDGVFAFTHPYGCSQLGDDQAVTQKILAGLVNHPNAAGVLVLGLGCENNLIDRFKPYIGQYNPDRVKFLTLQESKDEIEDSLSFISRLVSYSQTYRRQKLPVSKLKIGLNCGGSDGFSGITANPLVGMFSDTLIEYGGTAILTEVPEMFGAETILMNRCRNERVFENTVKMINDFKDYFKRYGQTIYENPSPGNKAGGISTLEEKSLGCIQKGGTNAVTAVLDYGQKAAVPGLNLLNGPGNDIVSNTSLTASGAQMILFTTGRGTPIGSPVPTVKISSNSRLYSLKPNWIDFDAGVLLNGESPESLGDDFFKYVISVASGEAKTKNELNGYREIAIFKDGVTL